MQPNSRPLLIGITGNIASGKSSFCSLLIKRGLRVVSADTLAKEHLSDPEVIEHLLKRFSAVILDTETEGSVKQAIDRKKLAELVFKDESATKYLNNLIHPHVLKDFQDIVSSSQDRVICFEVPLLFEARLQNCFDYLILVSASLQKRLERLSAKGETAEAALARLKHQISDEAKHSQVDLIIDNSGDIKDLEHSAEQFLALLPTIPHKNILSFA